MFSSHYYKMFQIWIVIENMQRETGEEWGELRNKTVWGDKTYPEKSQFN